MTQRMTYVQDFRSHRAEKHLKNTSICRFYLEKKCMRGSACPFAHDEDQLVPKPNFRGTRLCTAFVKKGTCRKGSECLYAHPGQALPHLSSDAQHQKQEQQRQQQHQQQEEEQEQQQEERQQQQQQLVSEQAQTFSIGPAICGDTLPRCRDNGKKLDSEGGDSDRVGLVITLKNSFLHFEPDCAKVNLRATRRSCSTPVRLRMLASSCSWLDDYKTVSRLFRQ
ncbi:unnamed protein product [Polarella glacialis]|uniref:C3H1-type domain-containing protein n=1 Tax=Polarella glacialis TaxID=89957 RepID=A0A813GXH8_POLGL|nr:unnamed protein product [Polarella glacialis]